MAIRSVGGDITELLKGNFMTRVLVVDDCEELTEILSELLEDAGYTVQVAYTTADAMNRLEQEVFDLVLCDLVLPLDEESSSESPHHESDSAMVGAHCIHQMTQRYPALPVIAISGELVGGPLSVMQQFGAKASLSKPFGRAELVKVVQSVLATQ
jgi:CheY-like chemotaxis protein